MTGGGVIWRAAGDTHVGRREHNEDALLIEPGNGLVMVADGVGGHQAGEVASQITCEVLSRELAGGAELEAAVRRANLEVREAVETGRGKSGMATTVVAARFDGPEYQLCWVGDSRAYLWDGQLKLLTRDHSYVEALLEQGQITFEEARHHPRKNVIVQAIGLQEEDKLRVGHNRGTLPPGSVLVLCSDGLSDVLDCDRVAAVLGSEQPLQARCEALVQAVVENGGRDNVTVVLVEIDPNAAGAASGQEPDVIWRYDPATGDYHGLPELVQPGLPATDPDSAGSPQATQRARPKGAPPKGAPPHRGPPQRVRPKSAESTQLMSADAMDDLRREAQKQYGPENRGRRRLWVLLAVLLGTALGYIYSTGLGG